MGPLLASARCLEHNRPAWAQADFSTNKATVVWGNDLPKGPDGPSQAPVRNRTKFVLNDVRHLALYNVKTPDSPEGSLLISDTYAHCIRRLHLGKPPLDAGDHRLLETFFGPCGPSTLEFSRTFEQPGSMAVDGAVVYVQVGHRSCTTDGRDQNRRPITPR